MFVVAFVGAVAPPLRQVALTSVAKETAKAKVPSAALPEQGYDGPGVTHKNLQTQTADWRREYGPKGPAFSNQRTASSAFAASAALALGVALLWA